MSDDRLGQFNMDYGDMVKAKYTRREPKPGGGYRYYYDEPGKGPHQGGVKPEKKLPIKVKHPELLDEAAHRVIRDFENGDISYKDLHQYMDEHGYEPGPLYPTVSHAQRMQAPSSWADGDAKGHHAVGGPLSSRGQGSTPVKERVYETPEGTYTIQMDSFGWSPSFFPGRTYAEVQAARANNKRVVEASGWTGTPVGQLPGYQRLNQQRIRSDGEAHDRKKHGPAIGTATSYGPNVEDAMVAAAKHAARTTRKAMPKINPLDLVKGLIRPSDVEELRKAEDEEVDEAEAEDEEGEETDDEDEDEGDDSEIAKAAGHKYISRKKVGNKWVYTYDEPAGQKKPSLEPAGQKKPGRLLPQQVAASKYAAWLRDHGLPSDMDLDDPMWADYRQKWDRDAREQREEDHRPSGIVGRAGDRSNDRTDIANLKREYAEYASGGPAPSHWRDVVGQVESLGFKDKMTGLDWAKVKREASPKYRRAKSKDEAVRIVAETRHPDEADAIVAWYHKQKGTKKAMPKINSLDLVKGLIHPSELAGLAKGGGEGSRGGHVIGHTGSGKPIYAGSDSMSHGTQGYTKEDHKDAIRAHMAQFHAHKNDDSDRAYHHYDVAAEHHDKAHGEVKGKNGWSYTQRRMGADPHPDHAGGAPETGERDPKDAYERGHPMLDKSLRSPLDLVKSDVAAPRLMRQGSVTYVNAPAYEAGPQRSIPSLQAPSDPAHESAERDTTNPLDLVRMGDGTLTHPTGVRRVDDGQ